VRSGILRLALLTLALAAAAAGPSQAQDDCSGLMRAIKLDLFDQDWTAVETGATRLLAEFPDCPHRQQAAYVRAQALDRSGQGGRALAAYQGFLDDYCAGEGGVDCGLARVALYDVAGRLVREEGSREALGLLLEGLEDPGDAGIFAALTLADQENPDMRREALPRLKRALEGDLDQDVRNRVCLAVLRLEPGPSPCAGPAAVAGGPPTLISVEVFDKRSDRVELKINMPASLADAVMRALPEEIQGEMAAEGVDVKSIFQAIRQNARGTIFEADTPDMRIRIWLQ
jgi:hypothetical protein